MTVGCGIMTLDTSKTLLGRITRDSSNDSWQLFEAVYRPFILKCIAARNIPPSHADDLCQDTLTQVFRGIRGFQHNGRPGAFRTWLKKIVSQKVWSHIQSEQQQARVARAISDSARSATDNTSELELQWDREHDRHVVEKMLELIRAEFAVCTWHAFRLMVLEGKPAAVAAEQLGISANAALIAKSRVMRRLRQFGDGMVTTLDYSVAGEES